MANNETTTKFKADISELKSEFQKAQRVIRVANSEFKAATGGMDNWSDSADGVEAKLSQLNSVFDAEKKKLESLENQYELTVKQEGAASKGAQELLIKINNQKAAVAKCESQISKYNNKLENLKTKNTETKTASEKLNTVISDQEKDLQELKDKYTDVVLAHGENSDSAKSLKKEINKLSGELHENKTKMQNAREAADKFDETLEKNSGGSSGVNAYKIALGHLMAEGIKKIIGSLKDTVTELSNVDSAYQNFASKTGKNAEEMEKYKEQIKDLYGDNYGDNLNDIADSMATVVQNTKETDPSKVKELTKNALVLRDTFGYDIQETMRAVNMLVDQFGVSGIEAFNLIVQGAQNGLDKNGDMLDSINEYSVHYKQMGYGANEFFNSLANGTEAGTFSVDKLGDAMKEFGIRTKDTSKTTQEGLALLGYTAKETSEDVAKNNEKISKTKDEISKLKKNLKYAKLEQEGFNDKTSELTKLKNADKIKEYSSQLEKAKQKLSALSSKSSESGKSIEDLQKRFAEGGEAAQSATQEVLNELFKMDDKVAQNQAGVALFGTMWEDLGIDGVKALTETQGSLKTTKKSMEELNKIKYDDMQNSVKALGREFKTEILLPVVEKALPKAKKGVNWLKDNYKKLIPIVKTLGGVMAAAFVVNNVAKFTTSIKTLGTAMQGLSKINPATGLAIGIGLLAPMIKDVYDTIKNAEKPVGSALKGITEEASKLNEKQQKIRNKTQDCITTFNDWKTAKDKAIGDTTTEFKYYDDLWTELQGIVDQNGKVKEGYENRATWIAEKLGGVTDTEIKLTGGVINEYDKLKNKLDEVLKAKQAEATYSANESAYQNALKERRDVFSQISAEEQNLLELEEEFKNNQSEIEKASKKVDTARLIYANAKRYRSRSEQEEARWNLLEAETDLSKLKAKAAGISNKIMISSSEINKLKQSYQEYATIIQNHEKLGEAILSGNQKAISESLLKLQSGFISAENGTRKSLERQTENYKLQLGNLKKAIKEGMPGVTQAQVEEMQTLVNKSETELKKLKSKAGYQGNQASILFSQNFANGMDKEKQKVIDKAKEISMKSAEELGKGDTATAADNFIAGFTNRLKELDPTLAQHMEQMGKYAIVGPFNNGLGVHSPSRETYKSGGFFVQGFENALTDKIKAIKKHVGNLAMSAIQAFNNEIKGDQFDLSGLTHAANSIIKSGKPNAKQGVIANPNSIVNNITYNQTNQSPKPLNRLDIYRNTKNLLTWKGGIT